VYRRPGALEAPEWFYPTCPPALAGHVQLCFDRGIGPSQVNEPFISSRRAAAIVAGLLLTTVAVVALVMLIAR
jgi:hypothetical protein